MMLAKNEDSVSSLVVADSTETYLIAFAGINSSVSDQTAGKNEHLRSFSVGLPKRRRADQAADGAVEIGGVFPGATKALGKEALFKSARGSKNDTYQRVLRMSPAGRDAAYRIGAIASGLAPENEVIAFRAASETSHSVHELSRIPLGKAEATDIDITAVQNGKEYALAYCTDDGLYVQRILDSKDDTVNRPRLLHQTSEAAADLPASQRPKFRCLRFLTPHCILLLQNRPGRTGAQLLILKINHDYTQCMVSLQKQLNKATKAAVGLDVCSLSKSESAEKQIIIAVAGQNSSIELLTIDITANGGLSTFRPYTVLRDVHAGPITKISFANFIPPLTSNTMDHNPQFVRLASVSVEQTVAVHTLRLRPYSTTNNKTPRYMLVSPGRSESVQTVFSILTALAAIALAALLLQAYSEIRGAVPPTLGVANWFSSGVKEQIAQPYDRSIVPSDLPSVSTATSKIKDAASQIPSVYQAASKNARDTASQVPSSEEMSEKVPSYDEASARVKDAVPDVPSYSEASARVKDAIPDVPSYAEASGRVKDAMPDVPSYAEASERVKDAVPDVPSYAEVSARVKDATPDVPSFDEASERVKDGMPEVPSVDDLKAQLSSLPSVEDLKAQLNALPSAEDVMANLESLVANQQHPTHPDQGKAIVIRDQGTSLSTELHHDADLIKHETIKKWEDMTEHQQRSWKRKLADAGHWTEKQGEAVLKGIFFSQLAGAVGDLMRGA